MCYLCDVILSCFCYCLRGVLFCFVLRCLLCFVLFSLCMFGLCVLLPVVGVVALLSARVLLNVLVFGLYKYVVC